MKFTRIKNFIFDHRYAIFTAIIVACLAGFPQIIARNALGPADRGIPYLNNDSEGEYLGRIHEILDGYLSVSSPVLYEYKDSISLAPPTGELIFYVLPMKLTGLSLSNIVFLSKFVLPALLFFIVYLFILSLLTHIDYGARLSAIAGALLIVMGYDAYDYRNFVYNIMHGTTDAAGLLWNRLVNPISGAILLFLFLWLLALILKGKRGWLVIAISGLVLSAMSGYIFSFALGLTIPVLVGFYFVWRKNWSMFLRVNIPVLMALLINIFYFAGVFLTMNGGLSLSDPRKLGMFFTHEPLINLISLASLIGIVFGFIFYYRKDMANETEKRWWFFSLATLTACELVYNQQVITGRTVWPQHFVQYTTPLSMAILAIFLHNILRRHAKRLWITATATLFIVSALFSWRMIGAVVPYTMSQYTELQSFSGVFDYFNINAPKDCVVYVSSDYDNEINRFIPGFTSCNVYHSFHIYNGVPAERIMHNYLVNLRLRGIALNEVEKHFYDNRPWSQAYFFRDWNDMFCCDDKWLAKIGSKSEIDQWFSDTEKEVEKQYTEYLKGDLYTELAQYRLDYFVVDTTKQPQVNEKNFPFLSFRGKFDQFAVYAVIKS